MSQNRKRGADDIEFDVSPMKCIHHSITCITDLSDEIFLLICRYLSPYHVLYSFYTPEQPDLHFHRIIFDYYTKIKLDTMKNNEYLYLIKLFCSSKIPFHIELLILSNQYISYLTKRYFADISSTTIQSIFVNLKRLTLIDCSIKDLTSIDIYNTKMPQLKYLSITIRKLDEHENTDCLETCTVSINQFLFDGQIPSIDTVYIKTNHGLILNKVWISHNNLRNIHLVLQTIDDLYILLDGLIPNVEMMIIQLCQSRILSCLPPKIPQSCPRLTQFTLLENGIGFVISDIKSILSSMPSLVKLTLSIRDTPDLIFSDGHKFESILNEYLPHLRQFDYTMTYRIGDQMLLEDFLQWPMNFVYYKNENCKWVHIYSLPWPSNKDDQRRLPVIKGEFNPSIRSDVKRIEHIDHVLITKHEEFFLLNSQFRYACQITTCLSIDIELPLRISKLILSAETSISSMNSIIQPSIRHLIIQCRLSNENEISILARLFPKVQYLELLFPLNQPSCIVCLKSLFSRDDSIEKKCCFWSELIHFSTEFTYEQLEPIWSSTKLYHWLIRMTDLKYHKSHFYLHFVSSVLSIWF